MRIAVFIKKTTLHAGYGGMEVQNKLLCEGFARRGHEVVVFSPKNGIAADSATENGVTYRFIEASYRYFFSKFNSKSWYNQSYQIFKEMHTVQRFDVVLSQSSAAIGIIERKHLLEVRVVSIAHGTAMSELHTFWINNTSLKDIPKKLMHLQYALRQFFGRQRTFILHSNRVIAVSSDVKKHLEEETFPPEDLITVIHNGVPVFEPNPQGEKFFNKLIYVGQLTTDKGVKLLMELFKDVRFKDFEIDIIGGGVLEGQLNLLAKETSTVMRANISGKLSHDQTIERFKNQRGAIFVFPTRRIEGFPMVLVEAMLAGLPVVAYNLGGVGDAVTDNETGYLVKFEDKEAFKNKVLELASDPVKLDKMSIRSRENAVTNFDVEVMLDRYEELLK